MPSAPICRLGVVFEALRPANWAAANMACVGWSSSWWGWNPIKIRHHFRPYGANDWLLDSERRTPDGNWHNGRMVECLLLSSSVAKPVAQDTVGWRNPPSLASWETGGGCQHHFRLRGAHSLQTTFAARQYARRRHDAGHADCSASICCWYTMSATSSLDNRDNAQTAAVTNSSSVRLQTLTSGASYPSSRGACHCM